MVSEEKSMKKKPFYSDISFWLLVITNLIVMAWALVEEWSLRLSDVDLLESECDNRDFMVS
jgi:hypothetical protein